MHPATDTINSQISSIEKLNYDTYRAYLTLPADQHISYSAGQYVEILLDPDTACAFSIANKPNQENLIELHIRHLPKRELSGDVINFLQRNRSVNIRIPLGKCVIEDRSNQPFILMAASSGFSQIKCFAEYLAEQQHQQAIYLYWGVNQQEDLYLHDLAEQWSKLSSNYYYTPVVNTNNPSWKGREGLLYQAILQDHSDLAPFQVYASGGPEGIYVAMDAFCQQGLKESNFHSDVLEYAPRNKGSS